MKASLKQLLADLRRTAVRRPERVDTRAMGRVRHFHAYDRGDDTFVFEKGVWTDLNRHASVLLVEKRDLRAGARGHVMTVTTGNHSVAALPLLKGDFWDLARVPAAQRGDAMMHAILCANGVDGKLEISQRDVPCRRLVALDDWLTGALGLPLETVVMAERNVAALDHYRARGQEWRVKPLAWTQREMSVALAASRKRIASSLRYYHSVKGVHFLAYPDFAALVALAETDFPAFREGLRELTGVYEGHKVSFLRETKLRGHHEVEFFGLRRGLALERLVPDLERLMESIVLLRVTPAEAAVRAAEICALYKSLLTRPELADASSRAFIETLYMYLTGEIYSVMGEGSTPAFDDRRTALPGATFVDGRPQFHAGADARSRVLLSNVRALVGKDEYVEYANVYELRTDDADETPIGEGPTREIVYKTNRRPLVASLVEKRLAHAVKGYGSYVMARVEGFKALGVAMAEYRLLRRRSGEGRLTHDYFIRTRCEGEPLFDVPETYFQFAGEFGGRDAGEDPQVVSQLAFLMGDAAAQNLAMKKYDAASRSPLYGVGKEIYRFAYAIRAGRLMPQDVYCCSVRGCCGWPDLAETDENLARIGEFYFSAYAATLLRYAGKHPVVPLDELAARFFEGFEYRTRAMEWHLSVLRDAFEAFEPHLPPKFGFPQKWRFVLWSLERQARRLDALRAVFRVKLHLASAAPAASAAYVSAAAPAVSPAEDYPLSDDFDLEIVE